MKTIDSYTKRQAIADTIRIWEQIMWYLNNKPISVISEIVSMNLLKSRALATIQDKEHSEYLSNLHVTCGLCQFHIHNLSQTWTDELTCKNCMGVKSGVFGEIGMECTALNSYYTNITNILSKNYAKKKLSRTDVYRMKVNVNCLLTNFRSLQRDIEKGVY